MSTSVVHGTVRSVCPCDCPDTCGLSVTFEEGKITQITGDTEHPVTRGAICNKVRQLSDRVYHPGRLLYPMRRTGPKGDFSFERITWEDALNCGAYAEHHGRARRRSDFALQLQWQYGRAKCRRHGSPFLPPSRRESA